MTGVVLAHVFSMHIRFRHRAAIPKGCSPAFVMVCADGILAMLACCLPSAMQENEKRWVK